MDFASLLGPLAPLAPLVNVPFIFAVVFVVQLIKRLVTNNDGSEDISESDWKRVQKRRKRLWILIVLALGFVMAAIVNIAFGWEGTGVFAKIASYIMKGFLYACVSAYIYHRIKRFFPDKKEDRCG